MQIYYSALPPFDGNVGNLLLHGYDKHSKPIHIMLKSSKGSRMYICQNLPPSQIRRDPNKKFPPQETKIKPLLLQMGHGFASATLSVTKNP